MTFRLAIRTLLVLSLAVPVVQCVLIGVRGLLQSMGDEAGAAFVGHVVNALLAIWLVDLVGLVILVAIVVLADDRFGGDLRK